MLTFVRTAVAQSGKALEAIAFAKEMAAISTKISGIETSVGVSIAGVAGEIAWISRHQSMTTLEEATGKLAGDAQYRELLKKAEHLLVSGLTRDHIWRDI